MATSPGLEEAIEKEPDGEDAYLVYGDWLQGEGDPRGELIALQAAAMRDPTKSIAKRVTELLARHDGDLLGALGEDMSVVWHGRDRVGRRRRLQPRLSALRDVIDERLRAE